MLITLIPKRPVCISCGLKILPKASKITKAPPEAIKIPCAKALKASTFPWPYLPFLLGGREDILTAIKLIKLETMSAKLSMAEAKIAGERVIRETKNFKIVKITAVLILKIVARCFKRFFFRC